MKRGDIKDDEGSMQKQELREPSLAAESRRAYLCPDHAAQEVIVSNAIGRPAYRHIGTLS